MSIKFGNEEEITELDENGSTVTRGSTIKDGEHFPHQYKRFKHRIKVKDDKDVLSEFIKFTDFLAKNDKLYKDFNYRYASREFDPSFHIENRSERRPGDEKEGVYYIVKCWVEKI